MKLRLLASGALVLGFPAWNSVGRATSVTPDCRVVKVVDGRGQPVAGAEVSLWPCDTEAGGCNPLRFQQSHDWSTDRNGRICAWELLSIDGGGALEVTAPERIGGGCAGRKHWAYPKGVPGARGAEPIIVKLDISPLPTAPLKGRITSADGRPIKGATIEIESIGVSDACSFFGNRPAVESSADGRFSFAAVAKGTAQLKVKHPNFTSRQVRAVVPSSDNDIVLDEGATWQGRVVDPDGAPVADCRVVATAPPDFAATSPCTEGRFSLRRLPTGDIEVAVGTDEHSMLGARAWITKARIVDGEHRQQDLPLPKGITVAGVIVDDDGAPIPGARLSALPEGARQPPSALAREQVLVRADAIGGFTFRHLAAGAWVIEGDLRAALKGKLGKPEVDATANRDGLRLIVPKPRRN
jgi:protocatechuate 3,4-dioxygenase beta subunit